MGKVVFLLTIRVGTNHLMRNMSRFERENLESSREQQHVKQNRESNQQYQTGRRISNISYYKSLGYSQQSEEGKDGSIATNDFSSAPMMVP